MYLSIISIIYYVRGPGRKCENSHRTTPYEELRGVVVDVLTNRERVRQAPIHYQDLVSGVGEVLVEEVGPMTCRSSRPDEVRLDPSDVDLVRDVFWDLFRQGYVVLGGHDPNEAFRLSQFGKQTLKSHSPFRFHDTGSFISIVKKEVQDISPEAIVYLEEAVAAFMRIAYSRPV